MTILTADGTGTDGERGIPFYTEALNAFTAVFAEVMNTLNRDELLATDFDASQLDSTYLTALQDQIASLDPSADVETIQELQEKLDYLNQLKTGLADGSYVFEIGRAHV